LRPKLAVNAWPITALAVQKGFSGRTSGWCHSLSNLKSTLGSLLVCSSTEDVQLPGRNGYFGILPAHAPLITGRLGIREITCAGERRVALLVVSRYSLKFLPGR